MKKLNEQSDRLASDGFLPPECLRILSPENPDLGGAFHSTKFSGLKFQVFHATNGAVFSGSLD